MVLASTLALASLAGCSKGSGGGGNDSGGPKTLKIGALFPFSGSLAVLGNENFSGFDIAREIANEKGWVKNTTIEFVKADVPDPTAATSETNRLISHENLQLLAGTYSSGLSIVASQVAERNKVLYWEVSGTAGEITAPGKKYTFRVNAPADQLGVAGIDFVKEQGPAVLGKSLSDITVGLVHEDSSFGTNIGKAITDRAKLNGVKVVADESYNSKSSDLSSLVLKLKTANPDVVIATSYLNDAILLWKQAKELNFTPKIMIGTSAGFSDKGFVTARGADSDFLLSTDPPTGVNPDALKPEARDLLSEFNKRYKARLNRDPGPVATLGFVGGVVLFRDTLPKAKSFSAEDVRAAALAIDLPAGSLPNGWGVKFAGPESQTPGQNERVFASVNQWQGGDLKLIHPANLGTATAKGLPLKAWNQR